MGRAIWKGTITFGLVSIPIQLETAVREKTVHFNILSADGTCRLRQKLYCPETGKEFEYGQTARGIEVAPGEYVIVDKKEIEKIKPERGRAIEVEQFVKLDEIDPIYFDAVYYVTPGEGGAKAYRLFVEALKERKRIGLARFVIHDRQHLAAIRVMGKGLALHTLHYADEVVSLEDVLPGSATSGAGSAAEVKMAQQLVEQMTMPLHLEKFRDDYREQLEAIIEQKKKGKKTVEVSDEEDAEHIPPTHNLMEALKRSLESGKHGQDGHHARRKSA